MLSSHVLITSSLLNNNAAHLDQLFTHLSRRGLHNMAWSCLTAAPRHVLPPLTKLAATAGANTVENVFVM